MANTASLAVATNIFTSPGEAFAAIKERPNAWLPIVVLILGACATSFLYLSAVDMPWLIDRQLQTAGAQMTEQQRTQAVEAITNIPPLVYGAAGAASAALSLLAAFALVAFYFTGIAFATNTGIKFKQWFALVAWCSVPRLLGIGTSLVNLLVNDVRFMPAEALNPLSFGNLLAIDSEGVSVLERVLLALDITTIWSVVLVVIGYQAWTQRSFAHAATMVLGPLAAIVLVGVLVAM